MAERLSDEQKHELKNRLRDITRTLVEIAGEMGISPGTAGYWGKEWNLPRSKRKRNKK
jgi:transposase-like protein